MTAQPQSYAHLLSVMALLGRAREANAAACAAQQVVEVARKLPSQGLTVIQAAELEKLLAAEKPHREALEALLAELYRELHTLYQACSNLTEGRRHYRQKHLKAGLQAIGYHLLSDPGAYCPKNQTPSEVLVKAYWMGGEDAKQWLNVCEQELIKAYS